MLGARRRGFQSTLTPVAAALAALGSAPILIDQSGNSTAVWQLQSGHYVNAKFPLEIIAPRAGLTTTNRYYKQYPGIPYRVPVSFFGGARPAHYDISGPSGMTIGANYGDTDYGIINWTNPVAGTYSITVTVTDQQGAVATVTWTLTVDTTNALFLSGSGNDSNNGLTPGSPKQTINGWYKGAKADTTYQNYFVYYDNGSYSTTTNATEAGNDSGHRMAMPDGKPKVHIGYGTAVNQSVASGVWIWYGNSTGNIWMSGMSFDGATTAGDGRVLSWDAGPDDIVIFENTFAIPVDAGVSGKNPAIIMSRANATSTYISIIKNDFQGANGHDVFLGYSTDKVVGRSNTISNNDSHGFYAKVTNQHWSIYENTGLTGNTTELVQLDGFNTCDSIEVCWNNYKSTGNGILFGLTSNVPTSNLYSYRNTWQIAHHTLSNAVASVTFDGDVCQYTDATANAHGIKVSSGSITSGTYLHEECVGTGVSIVTSAGILTGAYASFAGTNGHVPQ